MLEWMTGKTMMLIILVNCSFMVNSLLLLARVMLKKRYVLFYDSFMTKTLRPSPACCLLRDFADVRALIAVMFAVYDIPFRAHPTLLQRSQSQQAEREAYGSKR